MMEILIFLLVMYFVIGEVSDYARDRRAQVKKRANKEDNNG